MLLNFVTLSCKILVSWSPKGKQLVVAVTGRIDGTSGMDSIENSTSIVQVDHDLKVKRVIPISGLLKDTLKGSSYFFIVYIEILYLSLRGFDGRRLF